MKKRYSSMSNLDVVQSYLDGKRPYLTISYNQSEKDKYRRAGEEWEENGMRYKREKGKTIKLTKTQGDIIRDAISNGMDCIQCGMKWKFSGKLDRKFLLRTRLCESCLIEYETKLRILGIYDPYEKYRLASYELGFLKERKLKLDEIIEYFNHNDGNVIKPAESEYDENIIWKNTNKEKIVADVTEDWKKVNELITSGTKLIKEYKKVYLNSLKKYKLPDIITKK
jgi:hypothetical protein